MVTLVREWNDEDLSGVGSVKGEGGLDLETVNIDNSS